MISPSVKPGDTPSSACINILSLLNCLISTLIFLYTPLESSGSNSQTFKTRDCSFCLTIVLLLLNCSLSTPGGET